MVYLLSAIASSAMVSIVMRITEKYVRHAMVMFTANYAVCLLFSRLYIGNTRFFTQEKGIGAAVVLGVISGFFYLLCFVLLQKNICHNGVILSSATMKLGSVLIPVLIAILLFHEPMGWIQLAGISIAAAAIVLINMEKGSREKGHISQGRKKLWLTLLLLGSGLTDTMTNIYDKTGTEVLKNHYLFYTFLAALLTALVMALLKKQKIRLADIGSGLLIGIPNYFSARFLLLSLGKIPAVIAYPVYSSGTIMITSMAGLLIFNEKLNFHKKLALVLILSALVLLNLKI
mgnify:CR=1 FL=1